MTTYVYCLSVQLKTEGRYAVTGYFDAIPDDGAIREVTFSQIVTASGDAAKVGDAIAHALSVAGRGIPSLPPIDVGDDACSEVTAGYEYQDATILLQRIPLIRVAPQQKETRQ